MPPKRIKETETETPTGTKTKGKRKPDPETTTSEEDDSIDKNWCIVILKFLGFYWRGIFLVIWPFISALVFLLGFEPKFRCLFVVVLMAGYWVTECIPLYVTGLLPVVLFPFLDVQSTDKVCRNYLNKTNFMFLGSIGIALSIEYCGLHYRIAYRAILTYSFKFDQLPFRNGFKYRLLVSGIGFCVGQLVTIMGCSPRKLHFGLCLTTTLLSMFLINTATTAMMCPVLQAILLELEAQGVGSMYKPKLPDEERARPTNVTIALFLTAAFASSIGGMGTLVGTGTNLAYKGVYESRFYAAEAEGIEFVPWMLFNVPPMLLLSFVCWLSIEFVYMGLWRPNSEEYKTIELANEHADAAKNVIKKKMEELGPYSWTEVWVAVLFCICILLWLFRRPQFIPGWGIIYSIKMGDASAAIGVFVILTMIPASYACFQFCTKEKAARPEKTTSPAISWSLMQQKFPWGLLFLLGGGFAISDAGEKSGMSKYLGEKLTVMKDMPSVVVSALTTLFAEWATELTANIAICNIVVPVLMELSVAMKIHPIRYSLPAAVMCSCAFLLPVGTPPNAIAAGFANIKTVDMVKGGIILKICAWILYVVLIPTYGQLIFPSAEFPKWALVEKTTKAAF